MVWIGAVVTKRLVKSWLVVVAVMGMRVSRFVSLAGKKKTQFMYELDLDYPRTLVGPLPPSRKFGLLAQTSFGLFTDFRNEASCTFGLVSNRYNVEISSSV